MSSATLSARMTTRLITSYRRAAALARKEIDTAKHERTCDSIARQLIAGGREDIAIDLIAETFVY